MKKKHNPNDISIKCGKTTDSFEKLKFLCQEEARSLSKSIEVSFGEVISVPFWTSDFPELICVGDFKRLENDSIVYDLDFSQSTL